jgi:hypothetical protein
VGEDEGQEMLSEAENGRKQWVAPRQSVRGL